MPLGTSGPPHIGKALILPREDTQHAKAIRAIGRLCPLPLGDCTWVVHADIRSWRLVERLRERLGGHDGVVVIRHAWGGRRKSIRKEHGLWRCLGADHELASALI
jgi:hypothetical protein